MQKERDGVGGRGGIRFGLCCRPELLEFVVRLWGDRMLSFLSLLAPAIIHASPANKVIGIRVWTFKTQHSDMRTKPILPSLLLTHFLAARGYIRAAISSDRI